jgi:hypothetical protein
MWRITLMYLCFALRCIAGEAELPSSTKATMDAFTKSTDKLTLDYNKAMTDARSKAIAGLTKAQEVETKKGNLDGALAIKKKIEELGKDVDSADLLGIEKDPIIGKWGSAKQGDKNLDVVWIFKEDGTGEHLWSGKVYPFTWNNSKSGYSVNVAGGNRQLTMFDKVAISIEPGMFIRVK